MSQNNTDLAKAFYSTFEGRNIEAMAEYLHPDIQFITPLRKLQGKEAYVEAAKEFASFFETMTLRTAFGEKDQVVVVYDVKYPKLVDEMIPTAALLAFHENLISRIELFYDARPFEK
jgi:hypothetical protein